MKIHATLAVFALSGCLFAQTQAPAPAQKKQTSQTGSQAVISDAPLKIDPAKEADIRKLFELTGGKQLAAQVIESMGADLKPMMTKALPVGDYREKLVDLFFVKFQSRLDTQKLVDLAVPIYDKHLSREDIRGLIEFYQTPLGQKTLQAIPAIMSEMQQAGRKWGEDLGRSSMQEVLAEHPDLAKQLEDAAKAAQPH